MTNHHALCCALLLLHHFTFQCAWHMGCLLQRDHTLPRGLATSSARCSLHRNQTPLFHPFPCLWATAPQHARRRRARLAGRTTTVATAMTRSLPSRYTLLTTEESKVHALADIAKQSTSSSGDAATVKKGSIRGRIFLGRDVKLPDGYGGT